MGSQSDSTPRVCFGLFEPVPLWIFTDLVRKWALICLLSIFSFISLSPSPWLSSFVLKFDPSSELSGRHCRCEEASFSVCSSVLSSHLFSLALCTVNGRRYTLVHQFYNTGRKTEGLWWKNIKLGFDYAAECFSLRLCHWVQCMSLLAVTYFCLEVASLQLN